MAGAADCVAWLHDRWLVLRERESNEPASGFQVQIGGR